MAKYAVTYQTKNGSRSVLKVFSNKADAEKQIRAIKNSPSFAKLGYSNPKIRKE